MANQLINVETAEVSLVRKGANRKKFSLTKGETVNEEETKAAAEAQKVALEKAQSDIAEMTAKLATLEKAAKDAETARETEKAALEKAAKEAIEKAEAEKAELAKALEAEKEAKEVKEAIAKAAVDFKNLNQKAEDLGPALREIRKANAEVADKIESVLKSADAMVAQGLTPKGTSTGSEVTAWDKIEKAATDLVKADPSLSHAAAVDRVLRTNPSLYNEHNAEKAGK